MLAVACRDHSSASEKSSPAAARNLFLVAGNRFVRSDNRLIPSTRKVWQDLASVSAKKSDG